MTAPTPERTRWVAPWRNPWPRPFFIGSLTWVFVVWTLLPVLIAIAFSFNNGRSLGVWSGFTFDWYCCGGPDSVADGGSVVEDPQYLKALWNTLKLAFLTTLVSVPVGTALARTAVAVIVLIATVAVLAVGHGLLSAAAVRTRHREVAGRGRGAMERSCWARSRRRGTLSRLASSTTAARAFGSRSR